MVTLSCAATCSLGQLVPPEIGGALAAPHPSSQSATGGGEAGAQLIMLTAVKLALSDSNTLTCLFVF